MCEQNLSIGVLNPETPQEERIKARVVGTDERQIFVEERLKREGVNHTAELPVHTADVVIFPIPFEKEMQTFRELVASGYGGIVFGGMISDKAREESGQIMMFDYAKDEQFARLNAIPSAEGSLRLIMANLKKTIHGSAVVILGYGKIAKHLHRLLAAFGADIVVCARSEAARKEAKLLGAAVCEFSEVAKHIPSADVIVNTVPSTVLSEEELRFAKKEVYLQDLASKPGGIPQEEAMKCGLSVDWALALPSRFTPQTAADCVVTVVDRVLGGAICEKRT